MTDETAETAEMMAGGIVDPASPLANATTIRPPKRFGGVVDSFDVDVGLGVIRADTGQRFDFHAAELTDGTRVVDVGVGVTFELLPRFGRFQAGRVAR